MAHPNGDTKLSGVSTALSEPPNPTTPGDSPEWPRVLILDGASLPGAWLGTLVVTMLPQAVLKPAAGIVAVLCGMKCHGFDGE